MKWVSFLLFSACLSVKVGVAAGPLLSTTPLAGSQACVRLLSAGNDPTLSSEAVQATITTLLLVDYPLLGSEGFAREFVSVGRSIPTGPPQYEVLAVRLWQTLIGGIDYGFDPETTRQLQRIFEVIDTSPVLRPAVLKVFSRLYAEHFQTAQRAVAGKDALENAGRRLRRLWNFDYEFPTGTVVTSVVAPLAGGLLSYSAPAVPEVWTYIGLGTSGTLPLLWHFNYLRQLVSGSWNRAIYGLKRQNYLRRLRRIALHSGLLKGSVTVKDAPLAANVGLENVEAEVLLSEASVPSEPSHLQRAQPELRQLNAAEWAKFDAPFREESNRLMLMLAALREKWKQPAQWKKFVSELERLEIEFELAAAVSTLRALESVTLSYTLALREVAQDLEDSMSAIERFEAFLRSAELHARIDEAAAAAVDSSRIRQRNLDERERTQNRLRAEGGLLLQLQNSIPLEMDRLELVSQKILRLRQTLASGTVEDRKAALESLRQSVTEGKP